MGVTYKSKPRDDDPNKPDKTTAANEPKKFEVKDPAEAKRVDLETEGVAVTPVAEQTPGPVEVPAENVKKGKK